MSSEKQKIFFDSFPSVQRKESNNGEYSLQMAQQTLIRRSQAQSRERLPYRLAADLCVLPLELNVKNGVEVISVAVLPDKIEETRRILRFQLGREILPEPFDKTVLLPAIFSAYKGEEQSLSFIENIPNTNDLKEQETYSQYDAGTSVAAKSLEALVDYAIAHGISDIHITPLRAGIKIRVRKNGTLLQRHNLIGDRAFHQELVNRLKVLINAPSGKLERSIDGSFKAGVSGKDVRVRVSVMPSVHGENIVLRILFNCSLRRISELGHSSSIEASLRASTERNSGLIIVAGATGSGKTTTLYSLVHAVSKGNKLVHTIEDPVEQYHAALVQTEASPEHSEHYAQHLAALLRQDPDCLMIGELRDAHTAQAIIQLALTGHLTFTSVHAASIQQVFQRFFYLGIAKEELWQVLVAVVVQRLLPLLCPACKVRDLTMSQKMNTTIFQLVGCPECDYSGYKNRLPLAEAFFPSIDQVCSVPPAVISKKSLREHGIYSDFSDSLHDLWLSGMIDTITLRRNLI